MTTEDGGQWRVVRYVPGAVRGSGAHRLLGVERGVTVLAVSTPRVGERFALHNAHAVAIDALINKDLQIATFKSQVGWRKRPPEPATRVKKATPQGGRLLDSLDTCQPLRGR